ncbi:ATP synthase subunit I [uncultured Thiodictyon sp.]|uniref:ATP synthase subunit I n=1 Tax=uncultured Thiodictyon sp. TaxID=1846217 RepID=UPI0025DE4C37|nr:ATP synthase subunit I [uncultured Thiodictyon sp.]
MAIDELLRLASALLAGLLLGALFFGGLWWTLRKGLSSPRPAGLMLGSLVLRTGLVLTGFYFVGGDQWERLVACLLGFAIARLAVTRLIRPAEALKRSPVPEATHASES